MSKTKADNKGKRDIRIVFLIFAGIFGFLAYRSYPSILSYILISAVALLLVVLTAAPLWLNPLFLRWQKFAHFIGGINTQILLFMVFVFVFIPFGLVLKLIGKDLMQRKRKKRESYWEPYEISGVKDNSRYERLF